MVFQKGNIPWNKDKHTGIIPKNAFQKNHIPWNTGNNIKLSNGGFKKNNIPWNKEKIALDDSRILAGENHPCWKDGRHHRVDGYILIHKPEHPFANHYGYVREHRLVVEAQIGRYLKPTEECHHINETRDDNRPQNLMAFVNHSAHIRFHKNPDNVKPEEIIFDGRKLK